MLLTLADCGCRHLATSRESTAHFVLPCSTPIGLSWYILMDEKRIQCLSNASQHVPICLQPFPNRPNSTRNSKVCHFNTFTHFGLPGYASWTITVNVTWIEREIQSNPIQSNLICDTMSCQKLRSMYPSIFNRFPVIQPTSSNIRHFSTFLHILASPGTVAVHVTWMERGFNADQTHRSILYQSVFNRLRAIARYWSEIATFSYPLAFNAPVGCWGCCHWNFGK